MEQKSSKDILNELFSTFNASFDDVGAEDQDPAVAGGEGHHGSKKKKKKKSKKSKKSSKDRRSSSSGDGSDSRAEDSDQQDEPSLKKKRHKDKKVKGEKFDTKGKKKSRDDDEDAEDVDELIAKHRKNVKKRVKEGILSSSIGDIVFKNDELIKSKKKKREEDLRKSGGSSSEPKADVEDGEILDEEEKTDPFNKMSKREKHKKKHSTKFSASEAYKLDVEEKLLLGLDSVEDHHHSHRGEKHRSKSRSVSVSKSHSSRRRSDEYKNYPEDSISNSSSRSSHSKRSREDVNVEQDVPVVRHAPPRDPTPPPPEPPRSLSSSRSYHYKDTGWQKERDHYKYDGGSSSGSYSSSRRRDRYDTDGYYDRETTRRSDGRTGFGFVGSGYYDNHAENGDRSRSRSSHHHNHRDEHDYRRGRSKSPRISSSRSSRRSRSRSPRWRRSRSRSRERSRRHPDDIIDKAKLLEIARKNAAKLMKRGVLPSDIFSRDQILAIRAGGKSVDELTDYCQRLAKKDAHGDALSDDSGGSDGEGQHFIHHPFQVKDRPLPQITLNIRNAIPIPVRTPQELAIEGAKLKTVFPVSSGTQHRIKELEWHPVNKEEEEKKAKAAEDANKSLVPLDGPKIGAAVSPMVQSTELTESGQSVDSITTIATVATTEAEKSETVNDKQITMDHPPAPDFDISDVIGLRLKAMRQISENPKSDEAKKQLEEATNMMKKWADAKALEPKFLTQSELTQGPQAWAKRDQLTTAKEVQSPMGLHLLQKMGWKPGEGLGKNKAGDVEPLALEVKTDKKGLTSVLDYKKGPAMPVVYDLSGKHPISALMELTAKRKWGAPEFDLVFEHGPPHKKQFVYKVIVNGVEYQPCVAVNNKKLAKANAAAFCLQSLGLLPTAKPASADDVLQTVPSPAPPPPPPLMSTTATAPSGSSAGGLKFTQAHYLQTVPTATVQPTSMMNMHMMSSNNQPPQPVPPPEVLMPPPPPPPLMRMKMF